MTDASASDAGYTGPSVQTMLKTHTLASEIIKRHGQGPEAILDSKNVDQLRDFVEGPEKERQRVLNSMGTEDVSEALAQIKKGGHTLVDYIAVTWGSPSPALTEDEEAALAECFNKGGADEQATKGSIQTESRCTLRIIKTNKSLSTKTSLSSCICVYCSVGTI